MAPKTNTLPTGLLDADAAYAVVHQRVYAPRFFEKLAAAPYNVQPRTEEEALTLLDMASRLRQAYDAAQEKQAAARGSLITKAAAALDQRLGGQHAGNPSPAVERLYKHAADNGAKDAELAQAVLSLQYQAQLTQQAV